MSIYEALSERDVGGSGGIIGVAVGLVTNNKDPDGLGRVKLKFPWRDSQDESDWARIATVMAGNSRGSYFIPEVGDEVLVAFENGDIGRPFVLGALWNGKDKPPETNQNGKNDIREIRSRSGHKLTFDDANGKEKVVIVTKGGREITLDDGQKKIEIKDSAGQLVLTLDSAQNALELKGGTQLKITANQIELSADSMMTIKSGGTLTLQGSMVKIN